MDEKTAEKTIEFIKGIAEQTEETGINIVFHGGEPLLAPHAIWEKLLDGITKLAEEKDLPLSFSLQSNLWNLDSRFMELFERYHVSIGTSLDGPEEICDLSRGKGYFQKTMAGINTAKDCGQSVSAIATVTGETVERLEEILDFFMESDMPLVIHGAVKPQNEADDRGLSLSPEEYAKAMEKAFQWYIPNRNHIQIETLDRYVRGIVFNRADVCTFRDCLGMFFAVSPKGDITFCQRMCGKPEYTMGNVQDGPGLNELLSSPPAVKLKERQEKVRERCGECEYYEICRGGCYYNAETYGEVIDPQCMAYRTVYDFVKARLMEEMKSPENLKAISEDPKAEGFHPFFRKGEYTSLAYDPHPRLIADRARKILAIYALGKTGDPLKAAESLYDEGICGDIENTRQGIEALTETMQRNRKRKNNCYIHVTYDCNLRCSHCYMNGGDQDREMRIDQAEKLIREAAFQKFRQIVITGGEPLTHSERKRLFAMCREMRGRGSLFVLRTNLAFNLTDEELMDMGESFDKIIVSVDGSEETHDQRRGKGSYVQTAVNIEKYQKAVKTMRNPGELSLACVLEASEIKGEPGRSVRKLAERNGISHVRFKPLLPLGRALQNKDDIRCEAVNEYLSTEERLKEYVRPIATCGIGQNIFITPDGSAYPCYAWCNEKVGLGNVFSEGECILGEILDSDRFKKLGESSVDTIEKCKCCEYRYLCGGLCKAWGNSGTDDVNAPPKDCTHRKLRAEKLVNHARSILASQH